MNEHKAEKHGRFKFAAPEGAYPQARRPSAPPTDAAPTSERGEDIDLTKPDDTSEHEAVTADTEPAPSDAASIAD